MAGLLADLKRRGMFESTLVVCATEFGRTPLETGAALEAAGVNIVIWPVSSLRIAAKAMETFYGQLAKDDTSGPQVEKMLTRKRLYELIRYHDYEALDQSIISSVPPETTG